MQPRLIVTLTKVSELSVQLQNCTHTSSRDAGDGFVEVQLGKVFFIGYLAQVEPSFQNVLKREEASMFSFQGQFNY